MTNHLQPRPMYMREPHRQFKRDNRGPPPKHMVSPAASLHTTDYS
uniref:Uncharacterized protein n=1 Tax=Anguilla anguilla TaxID=7936 RepID=A0A0E9QUB8_ANGAN